MLLLFMCPNYVISSAQNTAASLQLNFWAPVSKVLQVLQVFYAGTWISCCRCLMHVWILLLQMRAENTLPYFSVWCLMWQQDHIQWCSCCRLLLSTTICCWTPCRRSGIPQWRIVSRVTDLTATQNKLVFCLLGARCSSPVLNRAHLL